MNKSDLKKLSKSELIRLLLKQEKKSIRPIPAPRKSVDQIRPIPALRKSVNQIRPIPAPCKSVNQMVQDYEKNNYSTSSITKD